MSHTIGAWSAPPDGPLAGTRVEIVRADGKGFTACRATGPLASEIRDFVRDAAEREVDREHARAASVRGTPRVRFTLPDDCRGGPHSVRVYGRLRQTREVILRALADYSAHLACRLVRPDGAPVSVPIIRPTLRGGDQ